MRILWGALRAVSVETMGILVVLWMLHGVAGVAFDVPWRATPGWAAAAPETDAAETVAVAAASRTSLEPASRLAQADTAPAAVQPEPAFDDGPQRATLGQWLNTLFPTSTRKTQVPLPVERRAEYTRARLDHYSQRYGFATRGYVESIGHDLTSDVAVALPSR